MQISPIKPNYICPHSEMEMPILGLLLAPTGTFSIFRRTRRPSMTRPKTTCFRSRNSHLAQVMKNWQPFESLPEKIFFAY